MSDSADQNFSNHTKLVPLYHYIGTALLLVLLIWNVKQFVGAPNVSTGMGVVTVLMLAVLFAVVRLFPLKAQDRIIRLEEQLRFMRLLPADLQARIHEFSVDQLVALRFASDAELPTLARRVLDEKLTTRKSIKTQIKNWRPDTFRV